MPSIVTEFIGQYGELLGQGVLDTLIMLFISTAIAYVIGTVLGVVLYLTSPGSLRPMRALNAVLGWVVNIGRSLPFIILLISLMPVTSALVGTTSGVRGVIPPLVVSTAPFVARMIEQRFGVKVDITNTITPVVGAHSGPGTLALFFIGDKPRG